MKITILKSVLVLIGLVGLSIFSAQAAEQAPPTFEPRQGDPAKTLNSLVSASIDGQKVYREAADKAASRDLKNHFLSKSEEREKFATELKEKVRKMGESAAERGSFNGVLYSTWIDIKTTISRNDDLAVLEAMKTGEGNALKDYDRALQMELPKDARKTVEHQRDKIESSFEWIDKRIADEKKRMEEERLKTVQPGQADPQNTLNNLVTTAYDSQKVYQEAADKVVSEDFKKRFLDQAEERGKFADELKEQVRKMGESAQTGGSFTGVIYTAWIGFRSALSGDNDLAVLEALKSGEQSALNYYDDALGMELPKDARKMVEHQRNKIESSCKWIDEHITSETKRVEEKRIEEEKLKAEQAKAEQVKTEQAITEQPIPVEAA